MNYGEIIVLRINYLCRKRRISYNKLAKMSGLNQSTIDNIVRGLTKNPQIGTIHHIANGFSMTLAEFLDYPEMNNLFVDDNKAEC